MIDNHELCLGNYLFDKDGKYTNVGSIQNNFHGVSINDTYPGFFSPIPLTPEILEKCNLDGVNGKRIRNDIWLVIHPNEANLYDIKRNETLQLIIPCKYLHQLQNLYKCLSGEELNIAL